MINAKAGLPYAGSPIANYIAKQLEAVKGHTSQREIAAQLGYDRPNMVSMFKRGEAKVPLDKVPALAKALKVDPVFLFRLALQQYWPDIDNLVGNMFNTIVSDNEKEILDFIREKSDNADPVIDDTLRSAIAEALEKRKQPGYRG